MSLVDGTRMAYHLRGCGPRLLCVPGGPARASAYLDDLGGLTALHELVCVDLPGTGDSDPPVSPAAFGGDALATAVGAVRTDLGGEPMPVLGHSAGGWVALATALATPELVPAVVLVTSGVRGIVPDTRAQQWAADARAARSDEPWYPQAAEAVEALEYAGRAERSRLQRMTVPFSYGRWDAAAQAHAGRAEQETDKRAYEALLAAGRQEGQLLAHRLVDVAAPVLLVGGALDPWPAPQLVEAMAGGFPRGEAVVLAGAAHYPWLDTPQAFVDRVGGWLAEHA